jgi:histidyl-tRNA synthetase
LVVVAGPDEISSGKVQVKNLRNGDQTAVPMSELVSYIQNNLPA